MQLGQQMQCVAATGEHRTKAWCCQLELGLLAEANYYSRRLLTRMLTALNKSNLSSNSTCQVMQMPKESD